LNTFCKAVYIHISLIGLIGLMGLIGLIEGPIGPTCPICPFSLQSVPPQPFNFLLQLTQPVEQVEDHRDARQTCAQVAAEPFDLADASDAIHVEEHVRASAFHRLDQPIFDEPFDQSWVESRARGQPVQRHQLALDSLNLSELPKPIDRDLAHGSIHRLPPFIRSRGLNRDSAASRSNNSLSLSVSSGGVTIFSLTYSSPRPPPLRLRPWPRSRSRWPPRAPAGMVISTEPSSVGTMTRAPSAVSHGATGRSIGPSPSGVTLKSGRGFKRNRNRMSPGGAAPAPDSPCLANRITEPSRTPAGMLTSSVLGRLTMPAPRHVGHGLFSTAPAPLHVGQVIAA